MDRRKKRKKKTTASEVHKGRLRVHDPFEPIRWLASSQPDPDEPSSGRAFARRLAPWAGAALLGALPLLAATLGSRGPLDVFLDLGPHDAAFISGFAPEYEVSGTNTVHWSTRQAAIRFPLRIDGPASFVYRFARPLPGPAEVSITLDGRPLDHFTFPGGRFRERRRGLEARAGTPLAFSIRVDAAAPEDLGLRFDWARIEVDPGTGIRLAPPERYRLAAIPLLLWLFFVATGFGWSRAFALAAPASLALAVGLIRHPWLTYRLASHLPLALALSGVALALALRLFPGSDRPRLAGLLMTTFLLRALAVSHPGFYHPDLRTHARFVEIIREGGAGFFVSPSEHIVRHGVWVRQAYGREYAFPYSPAFHLPFVPLRLDYDALVGAMPLVAAFWSVVPIALVWWFSRAAGLSLWGAVLMAFVPTYMSRLGYALMPSLWGHVLDVAFVCWLATTLGRVPSRLTWLRGALLLAATQLAYTAGVLNSTALVLSLALMLFARAPRRRDGLGPLVMLAVATVVSVALFYRDFIPMVLDIVARAGTTAGGAGSVYPVRSWLAVSYERTRAFFDGIYPVLAAAGAGILARGKGSHRIVLAAWGAAYFLLLLGRAKMPDLFMRGHEALYVTPLVCIASGQALSWLWNRGPRARGLAIAVFVALACQGVWFQWRALAIQLLPAP